MTQEEINEGNKIIAEFDGYPKGLNPDYILKYHTSWDWLMPVVDKIRSMGHGVEIRFDSNDANFVHIYSHKDVYEEPPISENKWNKDCSPIEIVFISVVAFIKWHTSQQAK